MLVPNTPARLAGYDSEKHQEAGRRRAAQTLPAEQASAGLLEKREEAVDKLEQAADTTLETGKVPGQTGAPLTNDSFKTFLEGKDPATGRSRLRSIQNKMYEVAKSDSPRNIAAATFLVERGYGKAKLADEDRAALVKGGVQLVYIEAPKVPMAEKRLPLPEKPDFIDAEFTEEQDGE